MNRRTPRVTTTLLRRRTAALKRHLPAAIGGDAEGVHQARVASRRLREAVPVLTKGLRGIKAGKARRKIRRLTRALGTVRELDVTLALLDELAAREPMPRAALDEVRAHVIQERDARRALMLERLEEVDADKLHRRLASVAVALGEAESEAWRDALASRVARRAKALAAALREAGPMYSPEHLHQVRIEAKKFRYGLELAADSGALPARPLVRLIKRAQDTLGRLHDLQVLLQHVAAVQGAPGPRRAHTDGGLDVVAQTLENECRHLHGKYVASVPALTEAVRIAREAVVPQIVPPRRVRRRPLKMDLAASRARKAARRRA